MCQRLELFVLSAAIYLAAAVTGSSAFSPAIIWSRQIPGSGRLSGAGLRKGNGVLVSRDGKHVWVTDDEGSLHVFDAEDQNKKAVTYSPPGKAGYTTESRSSVRLFEDDGGVAYAVYSVIDISLANSSAATSRIIAIDGNGPSLGRLRWIADVDGTAAGTPEIGSDGAFVYTSHNSKEGLGAVSVISDRLSGQILVQRTGNHHAPYGPVSKLKSPKGEDLLFWGESTDRGYANVGHIYAMDTTSGFNVVTGKELATSSATGITLSNDNVWYTGNNSTLFGWLGGREITKNPSFRRKLEFSRRNMTTPTANRVSASPDGSLLFLSSATTSFFCINATDGRETWRVNSSSIFMTEAKVSPNGKKLYSIEHRDGSIVEREAISGKEYWRFNCSAFQGAHETCQDSVEAEFSLSPDGTRLFWGDVFGRVSALKVGDDSTAVPTLVPSSTPTALPTSQPTFRPTSPPSAKPSSTPSNVPTGRPTSTPSNLPTGRPTSTPSNLPTGRPTVTSTNLPTGQPSMEPTRAPSNVPVIEPSQHQTSTAPQEPTRVSTDPPSETPKSLFSSTPTALPSKAPEQRVIPPTKSPTNPTPLLTRAPTSEQASLSNDELPTVSPSEKPTVEGSGTSLSQAPSLLIDSTAGSDPSQAPTNQTGDRDGSFNGAKASSTPGNSHRNGWAAWMTVAAVSGVLYVSFVVCV